MTMDKEVIIEVENLAKNFDHVQAVSDVGFSIYKGDLFGFLGPNGAGKTTTINILTGLARPDRGNIKIAGVDCLKNLKTAQGIMGIVPDDSNLYPELTGFENLTFCGALYKMPRRLREKRAQDLLMDFGLFEAADRKFGGYSKGMKRKLTIAAGIMHSPPILFLDEPTTGIDVTSARQIRTLIKTLNNDGTTIFLTTHYLEEAQRLCNRIAFIKDGKVIKIDSLKNLMEENLEGYRMDLEISKDSLKISSDMDKFFPYLVCRSQSSTVVRVESVDPIDVKPIVDYIENKGIRVYEARKVHPSLEDVFVRITGI